ncbi:MAG: hypothetical protein AAGI48_17675 [Verrucomicrobiota bacterium]
MNKYKVIDPKGLSVNGKLHKEGETVTGEKKQVHIATALHFNQIEEVKQSKPDSAAEAKAKAEEEAAKKKAEAEAKAKADAEAKAKANQK